MGVFSFVLLDHWCYKTAPDHQKFEKMWSEDIQILQQDPKVKALWPKIRDVQIKWGFGDAEAWQNKIKVPLKSNPRGSYDLDLLIIAWEENGVRGVLVQYDFVDGKTKNLITEISRTLILSNEHSKN
ncbi:MAG: hypothetical protein AB7F86_19480 [Bdellovibrionales bacterium]